VLVRETLAFYLAASGLPATAQCASLGDILTVLGTGAFDLALLDASAVGVDDLPAIRAVAPKMAIALITGDIGRDQVETVLRAGAQGVITKTTAAADFLGAVRDLAAGKVVTPPSSATARSHGHHDTPFALTRRELDVLRGLFAGKSNKEIGRELELQEVTVKLHVKTLSRKLNAKNRTHATMIARNEGLV
jgi:DNA-binding NarL/FixJ family response regulator